MLFSQVVSGIKVSEALEVGGGHDGDGEMAMGRWDGKQSKSDSEEQWSVGVSAVKTAQERPN